MDKVTLLKLSQDVSVTCLRTTGVESVGKRVCFGKRSKRERNQIQDLDLPLCHRDMKESHVGHVKQQVYIKCHQLSSFSRLL